ncbi:ERG2 and sigma1 receptor-like protein [Hypoxylon rubiginosum]|uniref:ERG2 and sigma1 receptor-like protein n=1 Tax=Hypoxylon rubiginosum TaxID=110542 RepID=A0ACB9Z600_9PEZI|nr:ERG2 and sigma1 receptor-like protein [Hypoxylon rubiginosum]
MAPNNSQSGGLTRLLMFVGILIGVFTPIVYLMERNLESFYVFKTDELHDLAKRGIEAHGNDTAKIVEYIVAELRENHPSHVNPKWNVPDEWVFNNAGGAMGGMYIIHASITEYLIIFGTAVGTEGHSGRHTADDYFHILTGEQWAYVPGEFLPEVYPAGSVHHLKRGVVKQYKMPEGCFALEYARGWIPPMLFFGFADGISSTLDVQTLYRTVVLTGREMISNLLIGKI